MTLYQAAYIRKDTKTSYKVISGIGMLIRGTIDYDLRRGKLKTDPSFNMKYKSNLNLLAASIWTHFRINH